MGFLTDLAALTKSSSQAYDRLDVKGSMAAAQAQLDALNQMAAPVDPQSESRRISAIATVVALAPTGAVVNYNPVIALELTVFIGGAPLPVRTTTVVAQVHLARIQPGAKLWVTIDPANPDSIRIDWNR